MKHFSPPSCAPDYAVAPGVEAIDNPWSCLQEVTMASAMDIDDEEIELPTSSSGKGEKKRFEVKKVFINL